MFEKIIDFIKDMLGINAKKRMSQRHRFTVQFSGSSIGKLSKDDFDEIGYFDTYGSSGTAFQGSTELSRNELYDFLLTHYGIQKEEVNIMSPMSFWGEA